MSSCPSLSLITDFNGIKLLEASYLVCVYASNTQHNAYIKYM